MSLEEVWVAAAAHPFYPIVSKESQFTVASTLLLIGEIVSVSFFLEGILLKHYCSSRSDRILWLEYAVLCAVLRGSGVNCYARSIFAYYSTIRRPSVTGNRVRALC